MDSYVRVGERTLKFTNLDKVYYRSARFTKRDVLRYYLNVAPALLPYLSGRPVSLRRFPEGAGEDSFFAKNCPPGKPSWVKTASYRGMNFCTIDDAASLLWLVNLGSIEFHPYLSTISSPERPSTIVFDLDPGEGTPFSQVRKTAILVRDIIQGHGLTSCLKTSGSKGLQLYVPLNTPVTYDETKEFSRELAQSLEKRFPKLITSRMARQLRPGKIFIDWSQNDRNKTTISPYSMRGIVDTPSVSAPLHWDELARLRSSSQIDAMSCIARLKTHGDPFSATLHMKQKLPRTSIAKVA